MIRRNANGEWERVQARFYWTIPDYLIARNILFGRLAAEHPDWSDRTIDMHACFAADNLAAEHDTAADALRALEIEE